MRPYLKFCNFPTYSKLQVKNMYQNMYLTFFLFIVIGDNLKVKLLIKNRNKIHFLVLIDDIREDKKNSKIMVKFYLHLLEYISNKYIDINTQ